MTAGRQLIPQGFQQELEEARQQAIEQGVKQGSQALLLRLLRQRFGDVVDAHVEQRIATASSEDIEAWSVDLLSAATLAELFAD